MRTPNNTLLLSPRPLFWSQSLSSKSFWVQENHNLSLLAMFAFNATSNKCTSMLKMKMKIISIYSAKHNFSISLRGTSAIFHGCYMHALVLSFRLLKIKNIFPITLMLALSGSPRYSNPLSDLLTTKAEKLFDFFCLSGNIQVGRWPSISKQPCLRQSKMFFILQLELDFKLPSR